MNTMAEASAPKGESDVLGLIVLLWRHKLIIIASALICAGIAVWLALTATLMYRAEASVTEVENPHMGAAGALASQFGGLASLVGMNLGNFGNSSREAQALLKSRKLVEEFVVRNKLLPVLYPPPAKPPTVWMAVKKFRDEVLAIRDDKRAGLTIVSITWKDPQVAARWANDFVRLANEMMRTRAITESQASIDYLNKQIATVNEVEVKKVMYGLVESETKTLMLANVRSEYALSLVDPAVAPELRFSPKRTLMVLIGGFFGGVLGILIVLGLQLARKLRAAT